MVETQEIRDDFSARLNLALDKAPGVRAARGRNVDLYEGIKSHPSAKASKQATHKWLNGESMPSRANMIAIADWLNVRVEWLAHGEGEMRADAMHAVAPTDRIEEKAAGYLRTYQSDLYESAPADQRAAVDDIADKMLRLTPEQAMKLKQAMDLLMPTDDTRKD